MMTRPEAALIRDFVDLGVTVGYVGNYSSQRDDRAFKIFAKAASPSCFGACDQSVDVSTADAEAGNWDTPANRAKLEEMREKLAAGKIRLVGADRWLAPALAAVAAGELPKYWSYV